MDVGVGIGVIGQSNYVEVDGFDNGAFANTGDNAQFSGPQVNITGQLALAGAQGGGALSLGLIGAGAFGGDADSAAANAADSSSWQQVTNSLITGIANAINSLSLTATQANTNAGNAVGVVLADHPVLDSGAIDQSNGALVQQIGNVAVANSGDNIQADGGQANVTVQVAADGSQAGGSAALAFGGAVAVDGDATERGREHLGQRQHHAGNQRHDDGRCDCHQPGSGRRDPEQPQRGRHDLSRSLARTDRGGGAAAPPPGPSLLFSQHLAAPGREQAATR